MPKRIFAAVLFVTLTGIAGLSALKVAAAPNQSPGQADPVIGWPFPISAVPDPAVERAPAIAYNSQDHEFLVVWENDRPSADNDIYAQRVSIDGRLLSWFYVADGTDPDVAYNPKHNDYLVVYSKLVGGDTDIYARRVDYTGPLHPEFFVSNVLDRDEMRPRLDYNTHPSYDSFLVVWYEIDFSGTSDWVYVRGQLVTGVEGAGFLGGNTLITEHNIAVDQVNYHSVPDVTYNLNHNEFLVVYVKDPSLAGGTGAEDIYGRRMTADGVLLAENPIDVFEGKQDYPAVAAYRLNSSYPYFVVYDDYWGDPNGSVRGIRLQVDGTPGAGATYINVAATLGIQQRSPHIASSEALGGYTVTWAEYNSGFGAWHAYARRLTGDGSLWGEAFSVSSLGAAAGSSGNHPVVAGGAPVALSAFETSTGISGRLIGYRVNLPLIVR
ncbi:MAG: hypothetical protein PVF85_12685 [Anaerolineales bacterium]|jgi:hypothetical protein